MLTGDVKDEKALLPMVAKVLAYLWAKYKEQPVSTSVVDAVISQIMTINRVHPTNKLWLDVAKATYDVLKQGYTKGDFYTLDKAYPPYICLWQVASSMQFNKEYTGYDITTHVTNQLGIDMPTAIPILLAHGYIRTHVVNKRGNYINVYNVAKRSEKDE